MKQTAIPSSEYAPFYAGYVARVGERSLSEAIRDSGSLLLAYLENVPAGRAGYAYAPEKWTIKECLQHIIDSERIFCGRALRIARGDSTPLPGFEQDDYVRVASVDHRAWADMISEFRAVRMASIQLFAAFTEADLLRQGTVAGRGMSCRAVGFVVAGHTYHHVALYRERYE